MPNSLETFRQSFTKDLARPSRFTVNFTNGYGQFSSLPLNLRCENAELPGKTFVTTDQKFGAGPVQRFPYLHSYQDLTLSFILDDDMYIRNFFDNWLASISQNSSYNFQYKYVGGNPAYISDIIVSQYGLDNTLTYQVRMNECYPIAVNQLDLDWSSLDSHHKLTVAFAYTEYEVTYPTPLNFDNLNGDIASANLPNPGSVTPPVFNDNSN
jgi:hypothetical protein